MSGMITAEVRSRDRYRRALLSSVASVAARAGTIVAGLVSVPLTVKYLGVERFGMWMTISSVITMLRFTDLGIGNGLLNAVAEANGRDDVQAARGAISSAFFMLLTVTLGLAVIFVVVNYAVSWAELFSARSAVGIAEATPAVVVFAACFLAGVPISVFERAQAGYQEGYRNTIWLGAGQLAAVAALLAVISLRGGLPWLVMGMAGTPLLARGLNVIDFLRRRPFLRPALSRFDRDEATVLLRRGILFLLLELAAAVAFTSDNLVIARTLGPEAVTQYSIPMRLASFVTTGVLMIFMPLWPAYSEAIARGDLRWVRHALRRSLVLVVFLTVGFAITFTVLGGDIIRLWVGSQLLPTFPLLLGLSLWTILSSTGSALAIVMNAANALRFQVITAMLVASVALLLKIVLVRIVGIGGVIWATVAAYLIFSGVPTAFYLPRLFRRLRDGWRPYPATGAVVEQDA